MNSWSRWKGLLALAVSTSITGNVAHALLVAPSVYGWGAAISASIAPVFLFWHTHNAITSPRGRRGDWVGLVVVSLIALGAFAVSFMGLRELLLTFGFAPATAIILPLVIDVTIAGASWELVRESPAVPVNHPADSPATPVIHPAPATAPNPLAELLATSTADWVMPPFPAPESPLIHGDSPAVTSADSAAEPMGMLPGETREQAVIRMNQAGDSQRAIADQLGVSQATVSRILAAAATETDAATVAA